MGVVTSFTVTPHRTDGQTFTVLVRILLQHQLPSPVHIAFGSALACPLSHDNLTEISHSYCTDTRLDGAHLWNQTQFKTWQLMKRGVRVSTEHQKVDNGILLMANFKQFRWKCWWIHPNITHSWTQTMVIKRSTCVVSLKVMAGHSSPLR